MRKIEMHPLLLCDKKGAKIAVGFAFWGGAGGSLLNPDTLGLIAVNPVLQALGFEAEADGSLLTAHC